MNATTSSPLRAVPKPRAQKRARKIVFACQKGGPGKTTTSVHVAIALVQLGQRVLFLDLDAQGNATKYFGLQRSSTALQEVMKGGVALLAAIQTTDYGVDVLPGGANLDMTLLVEKGPMSVLLLKKRLDTDAVDERYDIVLMDCPPNLSTATSAALIAADEVMIPVDEGMALDGLLDLQDSIEQAQGVNEHLRVVGLVQTKTKETEVLTRQVRAALKEAYGDLVFPVSVPRLAKLPQSYTEFQPLHKFDPKTKGSKAVIEAFHQIAVELLARCAP